MKEMLLDSFMAFGPSVNYLFQVYKFNNTKSSKGFSRYLCLVTILSHTLKVFFWFSEKFKYTLLVQSILVIIIQLYLVYLCIKFKEKEPSYDEINNEINNENLNENNNEINNENNSPNPNNTKMKRKLNNLKNVFDYKLMWKWDDTFEYYIFYFLIVALLSISHLFFSNYDYYSFSIGFVSMFLEVLCSFPQIIELYNTKNQRNISKVMVLMWLMGNSIKVYYNIYNNSPMQLIIGAYTQVFCNVVLIAQIIYYYFTDNNNKNNEIFANQINSNKIIFDVNATIIENVEEIEEISSS